METILSAEFLRPYMEKGKRHLAYKRTVEIAEDLTVHSNGEDAGTLVSERRPSESEHIKDYRKKIFVAITKPVISKVITSLSKIRRANDWSINYDYDKIPSSIIKEETLEQYCEKKFPKFGSVTKWVFDVLLKTYLTDSNAVTLMLPDVPKDQTTYVKPEPIIFESCRVYDYMEGEYAVLYSTEKSNYRDANGNLVTDGHVVYMVDQVFIQRWEQIDRAGTMQLKVNIEHKMNRMPAFKVKGVFYKSMDKIMIYESRISAMVPHLKEAVREYSDLQAEVVQHVHSEKWTYLTQNCTECAGVGRLQVKGKTAICKTCKGEGKVASSPYTVVAMPLPKPGSNDAIPGGVPFGYVQKQVDIVKIQDERIDKHKYQALSAINMEFLAETPLSQSGDAKMVDRDELNTFVDSIAEDIVALMDVVYKFINDMRYMIAVPNQSDRDAMLPKIPVPQNYDLLSSNILLEEMNKAKTSKVNAATLVAMEVEYANKKFNHDTEVRDKVKVLLELDPFPGVTEDEKLSRLQNSGITEDDYILSSNMYAFVSRAIEETEDSDNGFLKMECKDQLELLKKYVAEVKKANGAANSILDNNLQNGGGQ